MIELGRVGVGVDVVEKLARALAVPPSYLAFGTGMPGDRERAMQAADTAEQQGDVDRAEFLRRLAGHLPGHLPDAPSIKPRK
jgi:hypothetical protein